MQGRTMGKKQQSPEPDYWLTLGVIRNGMAEYLARNRAFIFAAF